MRILTTLVAAALLSGCAATEKESPAQEVPDTVVEEVSAPPPPPPPPPPEPDKAATPAPVRSIAPPVLESLPDEVQVETAAVRTPGECARLQQEGARSGSDWISCVSVFYGTNRATLGVGTTKITSRSMKNKRGVDKGDLFSIRPESRSKCEPSPIDYSQTGHSKRVCHLGEVVVSIPDSRRALLARGGGAVKEARSGARLSDGDLKKYFALLDHWSYDNDPDGFADRIRAVIATSDPNEDHAFVFIHGFNVPFRSAAFRTAQLKYDMQIDGPAFFFSWPSNGNVLDYLSDQEDADLSVDALARYLRLVHEIVTTGERPMKLHIIAHSMGTRVTAQALARLNDFPVKPKFGHVVFAAGDLDSNLFEEWMGASAPLYDGVTIYTSRSDKALGFSGALRNLSSKMKFWGSKNDDIKRRIGFYPKRGTPAVFDMPGEDGEDRVKTIDVTKAAPFSFLFKIKHSTYAQSRSITDDIRCLFDLPFSDPNQRSGQFRRLNKNDAHWVYDPNRAVVSGACQAAARTLP